MSSYKKRLIFLTLDPLNPVIRKLIESLSEDFKIIVVSDIHLDSTYLCESIYYKHRPTFIQKFLLLFYRPNESIQEKLTLHPNSHPPHAHPASRSILKKLKTIAEIFIAWGATFTDVHDSTIQDGCGHDAGATFTDPDEGATHDGRGHGAMKRGSYRWALAHRKGY